MLSLGRKRLAKLPTSPVNLIVPHDARIDANPCADKTGYGEELRLWGLLTFDPLL